MSYDYSENILVQESAGHLLEDELGWRVELAYNTEVMGETGTFGRKSYKEILLVKYFRQALSKLNPWLTPALLEDVIKTFESHISSDSLMQINEEKYRYIRDGIPVKVKKPNGQIEEKKAIVIDFNNPDNNDFLAVKEMKIHGDLYRRRTDIVGFVNGIPILFIELKKNSVDVQNAYTDNYTDYLDTIPQLFYYNAFLMLSNGTEAKVGTLGSKYEFFHEWKRLSEQEEGNVALETMLRGICRKDTTTDGRCLKRLGRNSKPAYPDEMSNVYSSVQNPDFSGRIIGESTLDDVNKLEVYSMKEKLRVRDSKSTLPDLDDIDFLRDLQLIKYDGDVERLTIAGLLFVGKEASIQRLLPQAEVIYLHYSADNLEEYDARLDLKLPLISVIDKLTERVQAYSKIENIQVGLFRLEVEDFPERVFQEALLNALSHRDYQSNAAVYVKQYPDRIVIENPGGFLDGITEDNIITHPSIPRNKLIAETLQNLKYVQRTGQGVDIIFKDMVSMGKPYPRYRSFNDAVSLTIFSAIDNTEFVKFITEVQDKNSKIMPLAEMMILRDLMDNRKEQLSELSRKVQKSLDETKKSCNELVNSGLIEIVGKEYMLTAKVYEALKSDVEYTRDKTVQYIKAKNMILEYLQTNDQITSAKIQEMCGFTKQQARSVIDNMRNEKLIDIFRRGNKSYYVII